MAYDLDPRYPLLHGGPPTSGHAALAAEIASRPGATLALDGPPSLPWREVMEHLCAALEQAGMRYDLTPVWDRYVDWLSFESATESTTLRDDPDFAQVPKGSLDRLVAPGSRWGPPQVGGQGVHLVYGPGAALVEHDAVWILEHTRQEATAAVTAGRGNNLGQPLGEAGTWRRTAFVDWPLMDRHWTGVTVSAERYVDLTDVSAPTSVDMPTLRGTIAQLVKAPFRTRPTYQPGVWGGQWLKGILDAPEYPNLAWSYELIAPESDVTLGTDASVRVGFAVLLAIAAEDVLGAEAFARFGRSFPVRMDYLDTMDGAPLSAHVHPRGDYADEVFGLAYTQHESYYVMATREGSEIYLGLRDDIDPAEFRAAVDAADQRQELLELERFAGVHEAQEHQLYVIPAGTLHASGKNNVVLEISSTPYLYSLRVYDWLREDLDGRPRSVHPEHAFANLDLQRRGAAVDDLVPAPVPLRKDSNGLEVELGSLDAIGLHVRRLEFDDAIEDDTDGVFHVLNLVEGASVEVISGAGRHRLAYAETILIPAAVGAYRLETRAPGRHRVVKASVEW